MTQTKKIDWTKVPHGTKVVTAYGTGRIVTDTDAGTNCHPVVVKMDLGGTYKTYRSDGVYAESHQFPTLFMAPFEWPEQFEVEPPTDWSKVPIDTLIWVRVAVDSEWKLRYFAGEMGGHLSVWVSGATSLTTPKNDFIFVYAASLTDPRTPPEPKPHDYKWSRMLSVAGLRKWFTGIKLDGTKGIAVADDSGDYPHTTDDGVLWLDTSKPLVIEGNRPRANTTDDMNYLRRCPVTVYLLDDKNEPSLLGGTNGYEIARVFEQFGPDFKLTLQFESVTDMRDD